MRTRDEQVGAIANDWIVTGMGRDMAHEWAVQMVNEAEARGAEEQRRKDDLKTRGERFLVSNAEAEKRLPDRDDIKKWQEDQSEFFTATILEIVCEYAAWRDKKDAEARDTPSAYVRPDDFYNDEGDERCGPWSGDQIGKYTLPLYARTANVAALEARVKELEHYLEVIDYWTKDDRPKEITPNMKISCVQCVIDKYNSTKEDNTVQDTIGTLTHDSNE